MRVVLCGSTLIPGGSKVRQIVARCRTYADIGDHLGLSRLRRSSRPTTGFRIGTKAVEIVSD
jgi:hypothetical protein